MLLKLDPAIPRAVLEARESEVGVMADEREAAESGAGGGAGGRYFSFRWS